MSIVYKWLDNTGEKVFMTNWADAKKFIFEDILVYSAIIVINVFYDPMRQFLYMTGLQGQSHPLTFGVFQFFIFAFCIMQLIRKAIHWQYWK